MIQTTRQAMQKEEQEGALPRRGDTGSRKPVQSPNSNSRQRMVRHLMPQAATAVASHFLGGGGAPDAPVLPCISTHPTNARELGHPPILRGTLPAQHLTDVGELAMRQPRLPVLGALSEEPLGIRAAKLADDPRSCIPGVVKYASSTNLSRFALGPCIADHAVDRPVHSDLCRVVPEPPPISEAQSQRGVAKPPFPPCPQIHAWKSDGPPGRRTQTSPSLCDDRTAVGVPSPR